MGELKRIYGADWNLEIGTLAELIYRERSGVIPAILYDQIKGYPRGYRILFGQHSSFRRLVLTLGLSLDHLGLKLVDQFRKKLSTLRPIPHRVVEGGPVFEKRVEEETL